MVLNLYSDNVHIKIMSYMMGGNMNVAFTHLNYKKSCVVSSYHTLTKKICTPIIFTENYCPFSTLRAVSKRYVSPKLVFNFACCAVRISCCFQNVFNSSFLSKPTVFNISKNSERSNL